MHAARARWPLALPPRLELRLPAPVPPLRERERRLTPPARVCVVDEGVGHRVRRLPHPHERERRPALHHVVRVARRGPLHGGDHALVREPAAHSPPPSSGSRRSRRRAGRPRPPAASASPASRRISASGHVTSDASWRPRSRSMSTVLARSSRATSGSRGARSARSSGSFAESKSAQATMLRAQDQAIVAAREERCGRRSRRRRSPGSGAVLADHVAQVAPSHARRPIHPDRGEHRGQEVDRLHDGRHAPRRDPWSRHEEWTRTCSSQQVLPCLRRRARRTPRRGRRVTTMARRRPARAVRTARTRAPTAASVYAISLSYASTGRACPGSPKTCPACVTYGSCGS